MKVITNVKQISHVQIESHYKHKSLHDLIKIHMMLSWFFFHPRTGEVDLMCAVARPPATLMVSVADKVGCFALVVSMTTHALPTVEAVALALALEFDIPRKWSQNGHFSWSVRTDGVKMR